MKLPPIRSLFIGKANNFVHVFQYLLPNFRFSIKTVSHLPLKNILFAQSANPVVMTYRVVSSGMGRTLTQVVILIKYKSDRRGSKSFKIVTSRKRSFAAENSFATPNVPLHVKKELVEF